MIRLIQCEAFDLLNGKWVFRLLSCQWMMYVLPRIIVALLGGTMKKVAIGLVFILGIALPAMAQSQATTGVIQGIVTADGNPLPGATVSMLNTATNFQKIAISDANGRFRGLLMPLGPYKVTVTMDGFQTWVRDGLRMTVGKAISLEIALENAAVKEAMVVTAPNPVIETSRGESSTQIDEVAVQGLPNNGRNFLDFTLLTPGVSIVQGPDGEELTINGQKGINNNVSLDGNDFNNPFFGEQRGGQRPAFTFNLDAVEEIVVVTEGASAEYGRSSGGFVNVITKSGTNEYQGTAHTFHRNDNLNAKAENPDGTRADRFDFTQTQVGFTAGGPIVPDKIFYFITFDNQTGESTKQTDPNRIEQRVVDAMASLGSTNENGPITRTDDAWAFSIKTDFNLNESNQLTLRYNATDSEQDNGTFDVDSWGTSANATELDESWSFSGALNSVLGDSIYNELRIQYAREDRPRTYGGPSIAGQGRPFPDTAFDFGSSYRFGMPFFIPVEYHDTRLQINNNVSFLLGDHLIKAGFEYNETDATQTFVGFANGRYIFGSTDGFLNYLNDPTYVECMDEDENFTTGINYTCPEGYSIVGPVLLYLQQVGVGGLTAAEAGTQTIDTKEMGFFLQDQWQPRSNVTVNLGLRFEIQDNPDVITPANEVFFSSLIGQTRFGQEFPSDGNIPDVDDMLQPRFSMTWDPKDDGSSLVRMSAGVFYARLPGLALASTRSTNGSRGQSLFRNSELTHILGPPPAYPDLIDPSSVSDPFRPDVFMVSKDFKNPKTTTYSISYERIIAENTTAMVKYVYSKGENQTVFVNRNDPLLRNDGSDLGPWSEFDLGSGGNGVGVLTSVESIGESEYNAISLQLNKRHTDNLSFQVNYTYSKDKSHDDNERDPFTFRYARVTDLDAEWGYSDRDQRHRFNSFLLYDAPYGFHCNLRFSYRSAQPLSLTEDGTVAGSPQDRINDDGSIFPRNTGRKDNAFRSVDLRISRPFEAGRIRLEPVLEVFNLTNSKNLLTPETTNLIFNFDGTVQSGAGTPRQIQLGLKGKW